MEKKSPSNRGPLVIAGVDASLAVRPILSAASALADLLGARLEAVYVDEGHSEATRAAAHHSGVELTVVEGRPAATLIKICSDPGVVALVLGARSRPTGSRPVGKVVTDVALELGKPVLLVPPDCHYPVRFERWLVPMEASPVVKEALREVVGRVCSAAQQVTVLHVQEEASIPSFEDHSFHEVNAWSREFLRRYCSHPQAVDIVLRVGEPWEHVLSVAREMRADVIALVWHQNLGPGRAPLVRAILERSQVPVLLVPAAVKHPAAGVTRRQARAEVLHRRAPRSALPRRRSARSKV